MTVFYYLKGWYSVIKLLNTQACFISFNFHVNTTRRFETCLHLRYSFLSLLHKYVINSMHQIVTRLTDTVDCCFHFPAFWSSEQHSWNELWHRVLLSVTRSLSCQICNDMSHLISALHSRILQSVLKRMPADRCWCVLHETDVQGIYQINLAPFILGGGLDIAFNAFSMQRPRVTACPSAWFLRHYWIKLCMKCNIVAIY